MLAPIQIFGILLCALALVAGIFSEEIAALFKKKPKEEERKYLLHKQVEYRGQTILLRVMEYNPAEPTIFNDCLSFRVSWSAAANGCYTIVRPENIERTIKNFVEEAKAHIDKVLATPDHLAQVKDMLDKLEL
jgi:hypothetical protein